jgi:hypothetical protein
MIVAVLACLSATGCSIVPMGTVPAADVAAADPLNAAYVVDGQALRLRAGRHEAQAAPGSATMRTTTIFGKPAFGDLDDDGRPDAALLLVQHPGGSGAFFYLAAALNRGDGYHGTNAVLLGDRIAPQNIAIRHGVVMANYADRGADEPMTAAPSIAKTAYLTVANGQLSAIAPLGWGEQVLAGWVTIGQETANGPTQTSGRTSEAAGGPSVARGPRLDPVGEAAGGPSVARGPADVQDAQMPRRPGTAGSGLDPIGGTSGRPFGTVLVFRPCGRSTDAWLSGDSPALTDLTAAYRAASPDAPPQTKLFAVLAGAWIDPPRDGFGARYDAAFRATRFLRLAVRGTCGE